MWGLGSNSRLGNHEALCLSLGLGIHFGFQCTSAPWMDADDDGDDDKNDANDCVDKMMTNRSGK